MLPAFAAFAVAAALAQAARADETPHDVGHARVVVAADAVRYFSDDELVTGNGDVRVTLPDGATATGDLFAMDLRAHRLLVAGHVLFRTPAGDFAGAAISEYLQFDRTYFLPLVPTADRWTFFGSDYAKPARGRDMPGDVFDIPDVRGKRPYVSGTRAIIDAGTYVLVEPATTAILMGPDTPPLPAYADNFSSNPAFGENALPGATFDAPYPFYGSAHTLDALHIRYDQMLADPYFLAFEHHSVGDDGAYAVFSLNPMTQPLKQWTLEGYDPMGSRQALTLNAQLFTDQDGFSQPVTSNGFADVRFVRAIRESSVLLDATQSYDSLIPDAAAPDHPFVAGVQWSGYQQPIGRTGFTYGLDSGASWLRDLYGTAGTRDADVSTTFAGITVATPTVAGPFASSLYGTAAEQRTWLDVPNAVTTQTFVVTDGKQIARDVYAVASDSFGSVRTQDPLLVYASPNGATGLTPSPLSPNGLPVFQTDTVDPRAVDRSYALTFSWQPDPQFQFGTSTSRSNYSPLQTFPPYATTLDVRANVLRNLFVTVSRTYFYDWFGQGWSPQFSIQVSGQ